MSLPVADILDAARRHGATDVRVFGSRARGDASENSDLDLLVRMLPGRDLLDLVAFQLDVEAATGLAVDVVTERGLSPYLRTSVLSEARPLT